MLRRKDLYGTASFLPGQPKKREENLLGFPRYSFQNTDLIIVPADPEWLSKSPLTIRIQPLRERAESRERTRGNSKKYRGSFSYKKAKA
jgi:hypothetical protein